MYGPVWLWRRPVWFVLIHGPAWLGGWAGVIIIIIMFVY